MAHEWFPWYPALYRADTMHLTAEQDGVYRRLIDHYMETRQPLPDSDVALARIAGITGEVWAVLAGTIRCFPALEDRKTSPQKVRRGVAVPGWPKPFAVGKGEKRGKVCAGKMSITIKGLLAAAMPRLWPPQCPAMAKERTGQ